jgi:hypothetical protein
MKEVMDRPELGRARLRDDTNRRFDKPLASSNDGEAPLAKSSGELAPKVCVAGSVDGHVGYVAVGAAERAIVAEEAAMPDHSGQLLAIAGVGVVLEKALPGCKLRQH